MRIYQFITYVTPDETSRHNIINNLWDGLFFSVMTGLALPFLGVYAIALGATDFMLGLLTSLPALMALLSQFPAAFIVDSRRYRLRISLVFGFFNRVGYFIFAVIPFLPTFWRPWVFIVFLTLINFPGVVAGTAWTTMMGEIFEVRIRGRIFGDRNMVLAIVTMVFTFIAGKWLDTVMFPYNFQALFVVSFIALMISLRFQSKLIERPLVEGEVDLRTNSFLALKSALRNKPFMAFVMAAFVLHLGFNINTAMWPILYVRVLQVSNAWIAAFSIISGAVSAMSFRWWGRLGDRKGNRWVFLLTMLVYMPLPIIYGLARGPELVFVMSAASGFANAGFNLISFNALLEISPDKERASYVALYNTMNGITAFLMPMVGVAIYHRANMMTVFVIASLFRVIAILIMRQQLKMPAASEGPLNTIEAQ